MLTRVIGRFSCLRPVRIQVIPHSTIYTDRRPGTWQKIVDSVKIDGNMPCTHLPYHLTGADDTWPEELRFFPFFMSNHKKETAQLLRKTYPAEKRLIDFARWLDAVSETHPGHKIEATQLVINPALVLSFSAAGVAYSKILEVSFT